jgi:SPP1 gp7 family putative phage head morphogenesis protein
MIEGALKADGRIAAKNAVKIRAALRELADYKKLYLQYQETMPESTGNLARDRTRARAWAIMNVTELRTEALASSLWRMWAEAYVLGTVAASEWLRITRELNKAEGDVTVDWDNWKPGDRAATLMLQRPKAFQEILDSTNVTIKGMSKTSITDIGNSLAEAIDLGLDASSAALLIGRNVASPARALTIAITEQNRVISVATMERYKEAGLEKQEWAVSDPCNICAKNDGAIVPIGTSFPSGDTQPPAHPHCRCVLLPVIPGMEEDNGVGGTTTTPTTDADGTIQTEVTTPTITDSGEWQPVDEARWIERQTAYRINRNLPPPTDFHLQVIKDQFNDASIILEKGPATVLLDKKLTTVTDEMLDAFLTNFDEVYEKLPAWRKYNYDGSPKELLLLIKEGVEGRRGNVLGYTYLGHDTIWFSAKTVRNSIKPPRILTEQEASLLTHYLPGGKVKTRWSMPVAYEINDNKYTIAHELGHIVDSSNNDGIRGKFTGGLRRKYKEGDYWSAYGTENPMEAYAETFAQWLLGEQTPVTLAFAERFGWNLGLKEYWDLTPDELKWRENRRTTGQG